MFPASLTSDVAGVASLADPVRRDLYRFVAASPDPTSREQAAAGVEVPVHVAKFHLDKLVDAGLLDVEFRRLGTRQGRGGGRPSKLYRRSTTEFSVSLPARHYDLLSRILANAAVESSHAGEPAIDVAKRIARTEGRRRGAAAAVSTTDEPPLHRLGVTLADDGYEPRIDEAGLVLDNCPFHVAAQEQTEFVCGLNLEYVAGVVDGLADTTLHPSLQPRAGHCCVSVTTCAPTDFR